MSLNILFKETKGRWIVKNLSSLNICIEYELGGYLRYKNKRKLNYWHILNTKRKPCICRKWLKYKVFSWVQGPDLNRRPPGYEGQFLFPISFDAFPQALIFQGFAGFALLYPFVTSGNLAHVCAPNVRQKIRVLFYKFIQSSLHNPPAHPACRFAQICVYLCCLL